MKSVTKHAILFLSVILTSSLIFADPAFAAVSIKKGWLALDSNKKPVLAGSEYVLSGGKAQPIAYISNGPTTIPVKPGSVSYLDNTKSGKAQAIIIGSKIPGYKDAFVTHFTVVAKTDISKLSFSQIPTQTYVGKALKPSVTVKHGKKTLKQNTDYQLSYSRNNAVGTGTVTIKGKGSYNGTKNITFKIVRPDINKASVSGIGTCYTTGLSNVQPVPSVSYGGQKLRNGTDYALSYENNLYPGRGTVVITGKGYYGGTKRVQFNIAGVGDDLARFACLLSYSRRIVYTKKNKATGSKRFWKALHAFKPKATNASHLSRGCDYVVCTICRTSGYDKKMPMDLQNNQKYYLGYWGKGKTTRWKKIGTYPGTGTKAKNGRPLLPGDIIINNSHIWMYVGHDIVMDVYNRYLRGTDADKGAPKSGTSWVSGSYHTSFSACICTRKEALSSKGSIYRCVSPQKKVAFETYARTGQVTYA